MHFTHCSIVCLFCRHNKRFDNAREWWAQHWIYLPFISEDSHSATNVPNPKKVWTIEFGRYETHSTIADCMHLESDGPGCWIANPYVKTFRLCTVALSNFGHVWRSENYMRTVAEFSQWKNMWRLQIQRQDECVLNSLSVTCRFFEYSVTCLDWTPLGIGHIVQCRQVFNLRGTLEKSSFVASFARAHEMSVFDFSIALIAMPLDKSCNASASCPNTACLLE